MSKTFPSSFEDADPDPPESALREETVCCLSRPSLLPITELIPAIDEALSGNLTSLKLLRNRFPITPPPTTVSTFDETLFTVPVRHYFPHDTNPTDLPLILFIHGGGWAHQFLCHTDGICSTLSLLLTFEVISIDYTLSPEMRAGGALSQCHTVWKAVSKDRFVLIAGDSAGGNMAAGLVFKILEDDPNARLPDGMLLLYPVTDLTDTDSFSCRRFRNGYGLMAEAMKAYARLYADEEQRKMPLYSPVFGDFAKWPPSLVVTCQFDVLRDQGRMLAMRIKEAGRSVRYHCLKGTIHGCANRSGLDSAREDIFRLVKEFVEFLRS